MHPYRKKARHLEGTKARKSAYVTGKKYKGIRTRYIEKKELRGPNFCVGGKNPGKDWKW